MIILEYGDRDRPHVLLIHGMWMCHESLYNRGHDHLPQTYWKHQSDERNTPTG